MKKKVTSLIIGGALVGSFTLGATAAPVLEKISANLNWGVNFVVDGKSWTPTHVSGDKIAPIIYDDTNYLPVRAISEALGVAVNWDQATQTITLGETTNEVAITSESIKDSAFSFITTDKQYTVQKGADYQSGVVVESINSADKGFELEPNNQYQTVHLKFFALDSDKAIRVKVSNGNQVLKDLTLDAGKTEGEVTLDIGGVNKLNIQAESSAGANERMFVTGTYQ